VAKGRDKIFPELIQMNFIERIEIFFLVLSSILYSWIPTI
jgi:hypothetical protein